MKKIIKGKDEIRLLYDILKHKDKWYIDPSAPDVPDIQEITEKAKIKANNLLTDITFRLLWKKYKTWSESDKILSPKSDYYISFLNDLVFDLGLSALKGREIDWYLDSCNLQIRFI